MTVNGAAEHIEAGDTTLSCVSSTQPAKIPARGTARSRKNTVMTHCCPAFPSSGGAANEKEDDGASGREETRLLPVSRGANMEYSTRGNKEQGRAGLVVIGNGVAGMTAAIEARQVAPDLRIAVITAQSHPTISTPALKQFAVGAITREQLPAYPVGKTRDTRIEMVHATVTRIEAAQHRLHFSDGGSFGYRRLLLATGTAPVGIADSIPGRDLDGVLVLHRLRDYLDLKRRLHMPDDIREAVVIGGGIHASETVAGILQLGIKVHWLIRSRFFHSKALDTHASTMILERFLRAGVSVLLETEVHGIVGQIGVVTGVVTSHQEFLACQLVLVCTGTRPLTTLASTCDLPLECAGGFTVDDQFRTSAPDIFAAGDAAALYNPLTHEQENRPQWSAAREQGHQVGAIMAGYDRMTLTSIGVPWHATTIEDFSLLTVGTPLRTGGGAETLLHTTGSTYRRVTFEDGRLIGYLSIGTSRDDGLGVKRLIDERVPREEIEQPLLDGSFESETFYARRAIHRPLAALNGGGTKRAALLSGDERVDAGGLSIPGPLPVVPMGRTLGRAATTGAHLPWAQLAHEVAACIGCDECLIACPALGEHLPIEVLNQETLSGPVSGPVVRFARSCYQCGACVPVCPVGLHRDAMMLWLKICLLRRQQDEREAQRRDYVSR